MHIQELNTLCHKNLIHSRSKEGLVGQIRIHHYITCPTAVVRTNGFASDKKQKSTTQFWDTWASSHQTGYNLWSQIWWQSEQWSLVLDWWVKKNGFQFSFFIFFSQLSVPRNRLGQFSRAIRQTMRSRQKVLFRVCTVTKVHLSVEEHRKMSYFKCGLSSQVNSRELLSNDKR